MDFIAGDLSIFLAAIAGVALGAFWYSPYGFGKRWMREMGFTPESMKMMRLTPLQAMTLGFIATLVMSYVLAYVLGLVEQIMGGLDLVLALRVAFVLWLGFVMPLNLGAFLWENKTLMLFLINASYYILTLLAMAAIIALV